MGPQNNKGKDMGEETHTVVLLPKTIKDIYKEDCRNWRMGVRSALHLEYHSKGILEVSDNHVYELIYNLQRVPPPPIRPDAERVGLARAPIFTEREYDSITDEYYKYYEPTEDKVRSVDPSARSRKIRVFRYVESEDPRCLNPKGPVRTRMWDDDLGF